MQGIWGPVVSQIPNLIAALIILIVGWVIALIVSGVVRGVLRRTKLGARVAGWLGKGEGSQAAQAEEWVAKGVFYLIMIFVLVAFFQTLNLTLITEPLNRLLVQVFQYLPQVLGALILALIAWGVATLLRFLVSRVVTATKLEQRLGGQAAAEPGQQRASLAQTLGTAVYWLVFLFFLPGIVGALGLQGLLQPIQSMLDKLMAFLPNLLGAALIFVIGWFIARIVQRIVTSVLAAIGTDRLSERIGLARVLGTKTLSGLIGLIVYVLILIPVLIAGLNALALDAVTQPASDLLNKVLAAFPNIFAAALLLVISYVIAHLVAGLVSSLLAGLGFDGLPARLGLAAGTKEGQTAPSAVVGVIVLVAIMLFAATEASQLLGFAALAVLITEFTVFASHVILGLIIFALGLYLSSLAAKAILATGASQARLLALASRGAILVLAGAMALRQMGLANEIINLAFGLLLGAIAVALALAFGLGGREIAGRELQNWLNTKSKEQ